MLFTDKLNIAKRYLSLVADLSTIIGTAFAVFAHGYFWKSLSLNLQYVSVIITEVIALVSASFYMYANISFTFTSNLDACQVMGAVELFIEAYTYLWPGAMSVLVFIVLSGARVNTNIVFFSDIQGVMNIWFIAFNAFCVCYLVPYGAVMYKKGRFKVTGEWCWNVTEMGKATPSEVAESFFSLTFFEVLSCVLIIVFGALSNRKYKKSLAAHMLDNSTAYYGYELLQFSNVERRRIEQAKRTLLKATTTSGIITVVICLIDAISIIARSVVKETWPLVFTDLVSWLWGSMGFILTIPYITKACRMLFIKR